MYVPPYTPEMCPIELIFHLLKTRLCKQVKNFDLKLNSKSTEREIREVFSTISKKEILIALITAWILSDYIWQMIHIVLNKLLSSK